MYSLDRPCSTLDLSIAGYLPLAQATHRQCQQKQEKQYLCPIQRNSEARQTGEVDRATGIRLLGRCYQVNVLQSIVVRRHTYRLTVGEDKSPTLSSGTDTGTPNECLTDTL